MTDKAYAILLYSEDEDNGYLYFPIKRNNLVYGGMPQFLAAPRMRVRLITTLSPGR
ncbi:hypothetical protein C4K04_2846 [Pseudomonas chlororaphis]|uniref:Uncharacterized protein n=1 Tax=Pseudomonas chlororaphis TaxID=587753 RepID=A0A3G7TPT1_9PSED|nr:hypothetical protein [Pseudomonas chlororaphis]AZE48518.1 hypothetical protein C4K04_2846 [Pseudomonas chlororaphis]